jgi:hypothetical protein
MKSGNGGDIVSLFQKHEAKRLAAVVIDVQAEGTPGSENLLQISDSPPPLDAVSMEFLVCMSSLNHMIHWLLMMHNEAC